ncbi:MAG: amidohydrolase [Clostridiales Family XIII bacterium]|jgi:hippurate hydrolase|nr:amidohydrolase [Clostridiales Family XIII bacterium]
MLKRLIEHRRALHRIPELGFDLPKTRAYILSVLESLPCEITSIGQASVCAFFNAGKNASIAFRSDMDALPVTEDSSCEYASIHSGKMHACGHDGHMAILLTFAEEISQIAELPHNVLLVFQAAEETVGGAPEICESGIFEKYGVRKIFGLHLWPDYPAGSLICRKNEFMAKTCNLDIEIFGKSSHAAKHEFGIDALCIGVDFVKAAYAMESSEIPASVFRLLKFGVFNSGTAINVISGYSIISGTMRCFQDDIFSFMSGRLREIASDLEKKFGCDIKITFFEGYPALINKPAAFEEFKTAVSIPVESRCALADADLAAGMTNAEAADSDASVQGKTALEPAAPRRLTLYEPAAPTLTAEDFAFYLQKLPGVYFYIGTGTNTPLHNNKYLLDESVLPLGVEVFFRLLYNIAID